jgi:hypothetical protein
MRAMQRASLLVSILAFAGALVACGGGGDGLSNGEAYVGTYQVTLHQRNAATTTPIACTDFGPDTTGEEQYIKVEVDDFFDDENFLTMETCDTDPNDCFPSIVSFEAHGDHLIEEGWSFQSGDANCSTWAIRNYGVLTADGIRIESLEWRGTAPEPCDLDDAEALLATNDCDRTEVWEGPLQL